MSGHRPEPGGVNVARARAAGVDHHVLKPFDPQLLGARVSGRGKRPA
jgi:DNA-binding response OmpR family regulator